MPHPSPCATYAILTRCPNVIYVIYTMTSVLVRQVQRRRPRSLLVTYVARCSRALSGREAAKHDVKKKPVKLTSSRD